jgi:ABC-type branched-subunit amino acid transport system substrate-binding protein
MTMTQSSRGWRTRRPFAALVAAAALALLGACATVPADTAPPQAGAGGRPAGAAVVPPPSPGSIPPAPPPGSGTTVEETRAIAPGEAKIAALLPLSGPNAGLGRSILDAVQLALGDSRSGVPVELVARDTGGTPDGAREAARSAIAAGANLIVGPLLGGEVAAVAEVARPAGVPVLSLTNNASSAVPGAHVLGMLPQNQVERLVGFAATKGARRFALVAPDDIYGQIVEDALRASVRAAGGTVAAVQRHGADMNAISAAVKKVADGVDRIDAVLVAGNGDNLIISASFVPYYDISAKEKLVLIATVFWDDQRLRREASLHGAHIAAPLNARREEFLKRYRDAFKREAPLLASLGYDAAALAVAAIREGSETGMLAILNSASGFEGYDGVFRLEPDGTNRRLLPVLQFDRAGPKVVEDAPPGFERPAN